MSDDPGTFIEDLLRAARRQGADAADAVHIDSRSLEASVRLGELEHLERSESRTVGLRVFVGRRQAAVASADRSPDIVEGLVERAVAMARAAPEDPYSGLADPGQLAVGRPELDIHDPDLPDGEALVAKAREAEEAARAVAGVTNSNGGHAGWSERHMVLAASNGFTGGYRRSGHSISVSVLAGEGVGMETDHDFSAAVHAEDMEAPATVGRRAGERTVRRLGARKLDTATLPVVFEQRIAGSLLGHLAGAINGAFVTRGTSFLKDALGSRILPAGTDLVDDPLRPRGHASKPFDAEGLATGRRLLVEDGVLRSWLLDLSSARQLGLESTASASRGAGGPPSPSATNLHLGPGTKSAEALIGEVGEGLFVTDLIGMGVNLVTGDYSRGAAGYAIRNGELAEPVSEVTIAGRLRDMLLGLEAAGDLVFRGAVNAPTLRIEGMTVAGR